MSRLLGGRELVGAVIVRQFRFKSLQAYHNYMKVFPSDVAEVLPPTVNADGSLNVIVFDHYNHAPIISVEGLYNEITDAFDIVETG